LQQTLVYVRDDYRSFNAELMCGADNMIKKPAYIYTAAIIAIALFTACFIDLGAIT